MEDYKELIKKMIAEPGKEFLVKHQDFPAFHQAWVQYPNHDEIVGKALKDGDVLYRYVPKE
ncbi:hypothetical protein [Xylocopilactobacillus apis]|uniref:Uncharacterized protein n=1 Tax=Xylocopilactobacillus apis TaxID=2932183 RepID=A0AAU9D7K7_9LACO|nr:hypothetical protein [Xylocopilactobacillus apis]BDR56762.1 hypothetical protein KIMC2_13240 [Xylocopilactobacillus apis]